MSRMNVRTSVSGILPPIHEAGATQTFSPATELERLVSCALLGEKTFYVDGADIESQIVTVAAKVDPTFIANLAIRARRDLGLRHTPVFLLVLLASRPDGRAFVREAAETVLRLPKDAMDMVAMYLARNPAPAGKTRAPLPHCMKAAIRDGFGRWSNYQLQKYGTLKDKVAVRLRDLMFLAHPDPALTTDEVLLAKPDEEQQVVFDTRTAVWKALADDTIRAPDTWESQLSVPGADKRAVWEGLLAERKLGALALVRNLRNMEQVGVSPALVKGAMERVKAADVWPWQALAAARHAPSYTHDLDALMLRSCGALPMLPGRTLVLVDVSYSMSETLSGQGEMKRFDAATGLAVVLRERCEFGTMATFSDQVMVMDEPSSRGVALANDLVGSQLHSGTYLGKALAALMQFFGSSPPDRVVVITDEQSHDTVTWPGVSLFVINVAPYQRGVNFQGPVVRIDGWSGNVVRFLANAITGETGSAAGETEEEV